MQIHDELLLEVDARAVDVAWVAAEVRRVMAGAAVLAVPLTVTVLAGERWGSLLELPAAAVPPALGAGARVGAGVPRLPPQGLQQKY